MRINIIRGILIILLLGTFFVIFNFSSQDGDKSESASGKVTKVVTSNIKSIQKLEKNKKEKVLERTEKIIRKIAHFLIYTLVGILLMGLINTYNLKEKKKICISLMLGAIYASSDEFHQSFIPGRSAQITDVILDSMGVLLGILIVMTLTKICEYIKNKKLSI